MKYSINLLLWTDTLNKGKLPLLDKIKSIGFDAVELPMFDHDVTNAAVWGRRSLQKDMPSLRCARKKGRKEKIREWGTVLGLD